MSPALLDADGVASLLVRQGLMAPRQSRRVSVASLTRRHHNLVVSVDGRPTWFLKQARHASVEATESLQQEALLYEVAHRHPALAPLAELTPNAVCYDRGSATLLQEYLRGVNGVEAHRLLGQWSSNVAGLVGACLGRLHRVGRDIDGRALRTYLSARLPWALDVPNQARPGVRSSVLAAFAADRDIAPKLAVLRHEYRFSSVIHGDARLENILLIEPAAGLGVKGIRFVDWELASIGDPAWDIAAVIQHYAVAHIWSEPPGRPPLLAYRALSAFWSAYEAASGQRPPDERRRANSLAGARLIQSAYEHVVAGHPASAHVARIGRLAQLLLMRPDAPANEPWP